MKTIEQLHELVGEVWRATYTAEILHAILDHIAGRVDAEKAADAEIERLKASIKFQDKIIERLRQENSDMFLNLQLVTGERDRYKASLDRIKALPACDYTGYGGYPFSYRKVPHWMLP